VSASTFSVAARNAYLDCLTGKATSNATYKLAGNAISLQDSSTLVLVGGFTLPNPWTVTAGTATHTQTSIAVDNAGTLALTDLGGGVVTGTVSLTGGGGMVVVSALGVTTTLASATCTFVMPLNNGGTLRLNTALASAWANSIINNTSHPAMANGGTLDIYSGTQPATADTAPSGTKLWTATLATTNFASASGSAVSLSGTKSATAIASGTATWARWTKGALVIDGSVGTTGTDFIVNTTSMASGTSYTLTAATLTFVA